MGSDTEGAGTAHLWVAIVVSVVVGGGGWWTAHNDAATAKRAEITAEGQLEVSKKAQAQTKKESDAKIDDLRRALQAAIDPTTSGIGATRALLHSATDTTEQEFILQSFARKLRTESARKNPLLPYSQPNPSGTDDNANFLTASLRKYPVKVDISNVDLHGHYWRRAHLEGLLMRGADLRSVILQGATLEHVSLEWPCPRFVDTGYAAS